MITKNASDILRKVAADAAGAAPVKPATPTQQLVRAPQQNTPIPPAKWQHSLPLKDAQTIKKDDTVWGIFERHKIPWNQTNVDAFIKANKIDPRRLKIGQSYQFPKKLVDNNGQEIMPETAY